MEVRGLASLKRIEITIPRSNVEDLILWWDFPYPKRVTPFVRAMDLTGDAVPELVVVANQRTFYPSVVLVYWPERARWEQVLRNEGHIWMIEGRSRDGEGRLAYYAGANTLGFLVLCGAMRLAPSGTVRSASGVPVQGPGQTGASGLVPYFATLVPMLETALGVKPSSLGFAADGGVVIAGGGEVRLRLDRFGNPVPGPLAGTDRASDRLAFLEGLRSLAVGGVPRTPATVAVRVEELRSRFAPLMGERANRAALALVGAKAVAAAGDVDAGAEALRRAVAAGDGNVDIEWRLAHLEAVTGKLAAARQRIEAVVRAEANYRSEYDAPLLLIRILIETREKPRVADVATRIIPGISRDLDKERMVAVLHLRAHLAWDELGSEDLSAESSSHLPEGEGLACLARWRKGLTGAGDVEAMERGERENPDAMPEFRLARGAALLGLGRHREAVEAVTGLVNVLGPKARVDFADKQTLDLAEAIRVKALEAAGEGARSRDEALRLRGRLRPGLLPRILVEEVLRGAAGRGATRLSPDPSASAILGR